MASGGRSSSLRSWADAVCPAAPLRFGSLATSALGTREHTLGALLSLSLAQEGPQEAQLEQVAREYGWSLAIVIAPTLLVALGLLVCCLPLWISRCRAHRCCAPDEFGPLGRTRRLSNVGFPIAIFAALAASVVAIAIFEDLGNATELSACSVADVIEESGSVAGRANVTLASLQATSYVVDAHAARFGLDMHELKSSANETCKAVFLAADAADELAAELVAAGQPSSADTLVSLISAAREACDAIASTAPAALEMTSEAVDKIHGTLEEGREGLLMLADGLRDVLNGLDAADKMAGEYVNYLLPADPNDPNAWPDVNRAGLVLGLVLFLLPLLFLPVACCTAPGMALSHDKQRCCCAGFGVQWLGASWVLLGLVAVIFLVLGSIALGIAAVSRDSIALARTLPADFVEVFNGTRVCGHMPAAPPALQLPFEPSDLAALADGFSMSGGPARRRLQAVEGVALCEMVSVALSACLSDSNLLDALLEHFSVPWTISDLRSNVTALETALAEVDLTSGLNASYVKVAAAEAYEAVVNTTPFDFGLECPAEGESYPLWCSAYLFAHGGSPPAGCTALCDCSIARSTCTSVREAIGVVRTQTEAARDGGGRLLLALGKVRSSFASLAEGLVVLMRRALDELVSLAQCAWVADSMDALLTGLSSVSSTCYTLGAFGFLLCAVALCLYVPSAIAVQIVHGGVGYEPGCPRGCRSRMCCGTSPTAKPLPARIIVLRTSNRSPSSASVAGQDEFIMKDTMVAHL